MADETLSCFNAGSQASQLWKIYEALRGIGSTVPAITQACFIAGTEASQLYNVYLAILGLTGGGSFPTIVTAPTTFTDYSMFPGGVFPASGIYQAYSSNYLWTLDASVDTTWQQSPRSN
jgi:hypothetical protein